MEAAPFMRLHLQGDAHFDNAALSEFLSKNSASSSSVVPSFSLDAFLRSVDLAQKSTQEVREALLHIGWVFFLFFSFDGLLLSRTSRRR